MHLRTKLMTGFNKTCERHDLFDLFRIFYETLFHLVEKFEIGRFAL